MTKPASAADPSSPAPERVLSPEAQRALAEAEERRRRQTAEVAAGKAVEVGGQSGPDPTRFGDWEKAGIVSDF